LKGRRKREFPLLPLLLLQRSGRGGRYVGVSAEKILSFDKLGASSQVIDQQVFFVLASGFPHKFGRAGVETFLGIGKFWGSFAGHLNLGPPVDFTLGYIFDDSA
jgi:hypothetical protein